MRCTSLEERRTSGVRPGNDLRLVESLLESSRLDARVHSPFVDADGRRVRSAAKKSGQDGEEADGVTQDGLSQSCGHIGQLPQQERYRKEGSLPAVQT